MGDASEDGSGPLAPRSGVTAPPPRRRRSHRPYVIASVVLLAGALVLGGLGVFYVARINQAVRDIPREALMPSGERPDPPVPDSDSAPRPETYVIIGSESRGAGARRSDATVIAHLPADRSRVYLVPLPGDLWVDIPGHGGATLDTAHTLGGAPLTVATLEQLLDVRMDHAVVVDFAAYARLTDLLGGVQVRNSHAGRWGGGEFSQGLVTLRSEQALAYVRERTDLPAGDPDRTDRQQAVTRAILMKALSPGVLADPMTFSELLGQLKDTLVLDEALTDPVLRDTVMSTKVTGARDIVVVPAPVGEPDGRRVRHEDGEGMATLAGALRDDTMAQWAAAHVNDGEEPPATPTRSR